MNDNFDFKLISKFFGYNSASDRTTLPPGWLVRGSKNVYKKISGTIAARFGLKRRGTADATLAGIVSTDDWNTSLGATRVLRVVNYGAGSAKLQVESNIADGSTLVWYDLMTGLSLTRFVFDAWWNNTLKKDELLFVKGDSNIHMWHGGIGNISSSTANTIVLTDTVASQGFNTASGNVTVNGNTYAYTGSSASTLTGVSPDPTGEALGSVALSAVVTTANTPSSTFTNDYIKIPGVGASNTNQVFVGSYTSRLNYISNQSDYTDYVVPSPRTPGSPELLTLGDVGKGIGVRGGQVHIGFGTSSFAVPTFTAVTVGTVLTEQTSVNVISTSDLSAPLAHEFIDTVGNDLVYIAQDNQLKKLGDIKQYADSKIPSLSQQVFTEFSDEDFTGGHLRAVGDFIRITAPISGRDWMLQTRESLAENGDLVSERIWHPPQIRNISRFAVISGIEYGHSNANPQIYQIEDTNQWHDDSPSDEAIAYTCVMRTPYFSKAQRMGLERFSMTAFEGYMTQGTNLYAVVFSDYQGSTALQTLDINTDAKPAKFYSSNNPVSLGDSGLGDNPLGDGIVEDPNDQELLPKFRAIRDINPNDCFEYELAVTSIDPDSRWEILALGANAVDAPQQPVFLRK